MLSIEEVYDAHAKTVYKYLLSLTHDSDIAEELTQETFLQALKSINRYDGRSKITTWLCAIAKNCLYSYGRKHTDLISLDEITEAGEAESAGDILIAKESRTELLQKLHSLESEMREVVYLRIFGNLSFREIGDIMSKSENWSRVTFYRAKEKLKKEIMKNE